MIIVVAALKGGVGKTTTAVYLSALAAASRDTTLVDADPQGSAADWLLNTEDASLGEVELIEAPTERLLARALERLGDDDVAVVDTPPGHDRLLAKALDHADVVVLPTRVGGVEAPRVDAVLAMIPRDVPVGLVICSARTYTRDYQDMIDTWKGSVERVWGSIPERVTIAQGPQARLAVDGLEAYGPVWRRARRAASEGHWADQLDHPIGADGNLFFEGFFLVMLGVHRRVTLYPPTWDHERGEMTWDFGLGEPHPRGQYNATMAAAEVMTEGAWWRLGNESTARRFDEPTVCDVEFPTVALTQAEWDGATRQLHLTLHPMNETVSGQPTTMRVTGLDDPPAAFTATSPEGVPVESELRGDDLLLHTQVGGHTLVVSPR